MQSPQQCPLQSFFNRRGQTAPKTILFQAEFGKFVGEQKYNSTVFWQEDAFKFVLQ